MATYFLEWIQLESCITCNFIQTNTNISTSSSIYSSQNYNSEYGYIQETKYPILTLQDNTTKNQQFINPTLPIQSTSNILSVNTFSINDPYLGVSYYPILRRNRELVPPIYDYYFFYYLFYMVYSYCNTQYYHISNNFVYEYYSDKTSTTPTKEYNMTLIYQAKVDYGVCPINYTWKLIKVVVPISPSSSTLFFSATDTYNALNSVVNSIFQNTYSVNNIQIPTNYLPTSSIIPQPLLCYFNTNYKFNFGANYALNGSLPSNNSFFPFICVPVND